MNPIAFINKTSTIKKQVIFVLAILVVILSLPVMAVFSLGSNTLSILSKVVSSDTIGLYQGPLSRSVMYEWGNCTYWAALLRSQAGKPISNSWGNANTWATNAKSDGYLVDHSPAPTAIMQTSRGDLGHVAFVESVDPVSGSWKISEMNVKGLDIVDTATYPASAALGYNFIHDKVVPNGL